MAAEQESQTSSRYWENSRTAWLRLPFMALFTVILVMAGYALFLVVIVQVLFTLITNSPNSNLLQAGAFLRNYSYQILDYLTYNSEQKPYPFATWPQDRPLSTAQSADTADFQKPDTDEAVRDRPRRLYGSD